MYGAAESNGQCEVEFVLRRDNDCSDVFCGVADNREDDETDECFRERGGFDEMFDTTDHEFCTDGDQACRA